MSGHTKWSEIRRQRPRTSEQEAAIAEDVRATLRENALSQLRRRREITQQELAAALGASPLTVSRIEDEGESQLSEMRRFVEALGGELIVQVRIGDETFDLLAD
jgi:DNA-binding transcriptional regulator YiaG